jgi:hypothetical protein
MATIDLTYHTSIVSVVNESKEVTFMTATTRVGSKSSNIGISVLRMNGIPIGRANVSSPTTSAGYYLCFKIPDSVSSCQRAAAINCMHTTWGMVRGHQEDDHLVSGFKLVFASFRVSGNLEPGYGLITVIM